MAKTLYKKDLQITQVRNGYIVKNVGATTEREIFVFPSIASSIDHMMHHFEGGELTSSELPKELLDIIGDK